MEKKLSFIILTWNSEEYLERCISSVVEKCSSEKLNCEIILIDNGSSDNCREMIISYQSKYPETLKSILLSHNTGTTYSRNLGLKEASGNYICILDSDTEFKEGSIRNVLNRLKDKNVGIIAPKLILGNGTVQHSVKKFPTFLHKLLKIPKAIFNLRLPDNDFYEHLPSNNEIRVDSAISACWFFRHELIESVGLLDENIFYSPEDLDYCMRIRKFGLDILYFPQLIIMHHTQQISHKKPFSKNSLSHFLCMFYYFRKHGGWVSKRRFPI
jgi:GT2 family glycosyltransferase